MKQKTSGIVWVGGGCIVITLVFASKWTNEGIKRQSFFLWIKTIHRCNQMQSFPFRISNSNSIHIIQSYEFCLANSCSKARRMSCAISATEPESSTRSATQVTCPCGPVNHQGTKYRHRVVNCVVPYQSQPRVASSNETTVDTDGGNLLPYPGTKMPITPSFADGVSSIQVFFCHVSAQAHMFIQDNSNGFFPRHAHTPTNAGAIMNASPNRWYTVNCPCPYNTSLRHTAICCVRRREWR